MIDIEGTARAMFEVWHARADRVRNWLSHPDHDTGTEPGRDAFRAIAASVIVLPDPTPAPPPAEPAPSEPASGG